MLYNSASHFQNFREIHIGQARNDKKSCLLIHFSSMLNKIALIASAVCGITAITTSLRALGKSREKARHENETNIRTGCRINDKHSLKPLSGSSMLLYFAVTIIWFILALVFAMPLIKTDSMAGLLQWIIPFLSLTFLLVFIWWKILKQ